MRARLLYIFAHPNPKSIRQGYSSRMGAISRVKDKWMQHSPLHCAAAVESILMIRLLLKPRCSVNATDKGDGTALYHIKPNNPAFSALSPSLIVARAHPTAIAEGHGDAALELLKARAEKRGFR